jgi:hypothetical protein
MPCSEKLKRAIKKEMFEHPQLKYPMAKKIAQQHLAKKKKR